MRIQSLSSASDIKKRFFPYWKIFQTPHSSNRPSGDPLRKDWCFDDPIPYAARVFTDDEVAAAVSSALDFGLLLVLKDLIFRKNWHHSWVPKSLLVNSGSSANFICPPYSLKQNYLNHPIKYW